MNYYPDKNLFWFLKDGSKFDLSKPVELDMYVQQVITRGRTSNVKEMLNIIERRQLKSSLARLSRFVPPEVNKFWEDFFGNS